MPRRSPWCVRTRPAPWSLVSLRRAREPQGKPGVAHAHRGWREHVGRCITENVVKKIQFGALSSTCMDTFIPDARTSTCLLFFSSYPPPVPCRSVFRSADSEGQGRCQRCQGDGTHGQGPCRARLLSCSGSYWCRGFAHAPTTIPFPSPSNQTRNIQVKTPPTTLRFKPLSGSILPCFLPVHALFCFGHTLPGSVLWLQWL